MENREGGIFHFYLHGGLTLVHQQHPLLLTWGQMRLLNVKFSHEPKSTIKVVTRFYPHDRKWQVRTGATVEHGEYLRDLRMKGHQLLSRSIVYMNDCKGEVMTCASQTDMTVLTWYHKLIKFNYFFLSLRVF